MRCPDCKGSGKYTGALIQEECRKCKGSGNLLDKEKALDSVFDAQPKSSDNKPWPDVFTIPDTEENRRVFDKLKKILDEETKVKTKLGLVPVLLEVGDTIFIYDAGWYEAVVQFIALNPGSLTPGMVYASNTTDQFRIPYQEITFNLTESRWEHIKSGTPLWP